MEGVVSNLSILTTGTPNPRWGAAMAQIGTKIYLHGGIAGGRMFDDLNVLDTGLCTCRNNIICDVLRAFH